MSTVKQNFYKNDELDIIAKKITEQIKKDNQEWLNKVEETSKDKNEFDLLSETKTYNVDKWAGTINDKNDFVIAVSIDLKSLDKNFVLDYHDKNKIVFVNKNIDKNFIFTVEIFFKENNNVAKNYNNKLDSRNKDFNNVMNNIEKQFGEEGKQDFFKKKKNKNTNNDLFVDSDFVDEPVKKHNFIVGRVKDFYSGFTQSQALYVIISGILLFFVF